MTKRKVTRPTYVQFLQIAEAIKLKWEQEPWYSVQTLHKAVQPELEFETTPSNVKGAMEALGYKLAEKPLKRKYSQDRTGIVAAELVSLLRELGKEPSKDLLNVAQRKGADYERN